MVDTTQLMLDDEDHHKTSCAALQVKEGLEETQEIGRWVHQFSYLAKMTNIVLEYFSWQVWHEKYLGCLLNMLFGVINVLLDVVCKMNYLDLFVWVGIFLLVSLYLYSSMLF